MGCGAPQNVVSDMQQDQQQTQQQTNQQQVNVTTMSLGTTDVDLFSSIKQNQVTHQSLRNVDIDYTEKDKLRCQQLNDDPNRLFAPPKLRNTKLEYSVGKQLQSTIYGQNYLGIEHLTGSLVEIHSFDCSSQNQQLLEAFSQNIVFSTNLRHPNIRRIFDLRIFKDQIQVICEISGQSLKDQIHTYQGLEESISRRILPSILQALNYAHSSDVTFNSLSPNSIFIGATCKVSSFYASSRRKTCRERSQFYYICPSFLLSGSEVAQKKRADIFALGQIFAEMSTTKPVFFQFKDLGSLYYNMHKTRNVQFIEYLDGMSNEAQEFLNQCLFQPSIQAQNLMQNQFVLKQENVEVDALQPENNNTQYKYKGENCSESALEALGRKLKFGHDQTVKCETEALWEDSLENLADNIILK
ncbi:Kinase [Hexamita inflata]|uniref:Kinase n=1 Tax=Hexamita inflata TaxID=28002 RepID=A0AA86U3J8_9EUKA|nr:Kinase [Hexamita inflata]